MIKVGYAEIDITPSVGCRMAAFPPRVIEGIHDPLRIKALAISDKKESVVVCACDLLFWQTSDVLEIQKRATAECRNLPESNIMLCCTHTHHAGENTYMFGGSKGDSWVLGLKDKCIEVITTAMKNQKSSEISFSQVDAPYNHNRRIIMDDEVGLAFDRGNETNGVTDPTMSVIRFDRENGTSVVWVNWTGHALTVGPANKLITADYAGRLCALLRERLGCPSQVLFTNGCAGNIHPFLSMKEGFDASENVARLLCVKAEEAVSKAVPLSNQTLGFKVACMELPHRKYPRSIVKVLVSCLSLGDLRIGCLPGEPFVEFQLRYRAALSKHSSFINGYCNGGTGYIPTKKAFDEGGYGADYYEDASPEVGRTQIKAGDGEMILEKLLELSK